MKAAGHWSLHHAANNLYTSEGFHLQSARLASGQPCLSFRPIWWSYIHSFLTPSSFVTDLEGPFHTFLPLATMKSFFLNLTRAIATLSILSAAQAAHTNSSSGASCAAPVDNSFFSVVGVQGCGVQPRLELRDLEKDADLWNMFLMAMARFQAMDQNQKISYYQIAGIHGVPFKSWDNVSGVEQQHLMGYCKCWDLTRRSAKS